jgi:hypothetical protein
MDSNNNKNLQGAQVAAGNVPAPAAKAAKSKSNPSSTQNTLLIAEVRDGIAIMNDGTFRAVIMCKSINFDLMSPQEREAVEFSYQGFLNSLYFPIQVFVRSQKVDLRPYLERLDKIRSEQDNMLLALLMEDYVGFLSAVAQQTNIMDKKFYVVISYPDPDEDIRSAFRQSEQAKTELKHRVESVMAGLLECGIQSIPLDTQELIELYYDVYNPDTATRQQLKHFDDLNTPVVTKGAGEAPQPNLDKEQS